MIATLWFAYVFIYKGRVDVASGTERLFRRASVENWHWVDFDASDGGYPS